MFGGQQPIQHNSYYTITNNIHITVNQAPPTATSNPVLPPEDDFIIKTEQKPRKSARYRSGSNRDKHKRLNKTNNFMNMTMAQMVSDKEVNPLVLQQVDKFRTPKVKNIPM